MESEVECSRRALLSETTEHQLQKFLHELEGLSKRLQLSVYEQVAGSCFLGDLGFRKFQ